MLLFQTEKRKKNVKRKKDYQISIFHIFGSKYVPVVKESNTILSLSFHCLSHFQDSFYLPGQNISNKF